MKPCTKIANTLHLSHDEWLKLRKQGICGSDAAAILGYSPYVSPLSVYADKSDLLHPSPENEEMRQGKDLEDYVAKRFMEEKGKKVKRINAVLRSNENPFMFANIDRWVVGENAGLECKTSKDIFLKRFGNGEYPEEYYCQCLHYMAVTGADKWYLAVIVFGTDFKIFEIPRDEEEINILIDAENAFWKNHVVSHVQPPADGSASTTNTLKQIYQREEGGKTVFTQDVSKFERYAELKEQLKALEAEISEIENLIKQEMEDAEKLSAGDYTASWKSQFRNKCDLEALREGYPEIDLSQYFNQTRTRVFTIKKLKDAQ